MGTVVQLLVFDCGEVGTGAVERGGCANRPTPGWRSRRRRGPSTAVGVGSPRLQQADLGLGQRVVGGVADAADRGRGASGAPSVNAIDVGWAGCRPRCGTPPRTGRDTRRERRSAISIAPRMRSVRIVRAAASPRCAGRTRRARTRRARPPDSWWADGRTRAAQTQGPPIGAVQYDAAAASSASGRKSPSTLRWGCRRVDP